MSTHRSHTHRDGWGWWRWDLGGLLHAFPHLRLSPPRDDSLLTHEENAFVLAASLCCTDIAGSSGDIRRPLVAMTRFLC